MIFQNSSRIGLEGFAQHDKSAFQIFLFQHIGYTYLIDASARSGVETGSRSHHYRLAFVLEFSQTPATEFLGIVDRQLCHGIEGAHGNRRVDTGDAVQTVDEALTSLYILVIDVAAM